FPLKVRRTSVRIRPSARPDTKDLILLRRTGAAAIAVAGGDVKMPVRAHDHLPQSPQSLGRVALEVNLMAQKTPRLLLCEDHPVQVPRAQRADKEAPLPGRDFHSGVKSRSPGRDRLSPGENGCLHSFPGLAAKEGGPAEIVAAACD